MVNNEECMGFLKSIVACISYGDYASAKELSNLELEKMIKNNSKINKKIGKIKKYYNITKNEKRTLEELESKELKKIATAYSEYILNVIDRSDNIKQIKDEIISIHEFIRQ